MSSILILTDRSDATFRRRHVPLISRQINVLFMNIIRALAFEAEFQASSLNIPKILQWIFSVSYDASCKTWALVSEKYEECSSHSVLTSRFSKVKDEAFRELGMQEMRQMICAALELHSLSGIVERFGGMVEDIFVLLKPLFHLHQCRILHSPDSLEKQEWATRKPRSAASFNFLDFNSLLFFLSWQASLVAGKWLYFLPTGLNCKLFLKHS